MRAEIQEGLQDIIQNGRIKNIDSLKAYLAKSRVLTAKSRTLDKVTRRYQQAFEAVEKISFAC